MLKVSPKLWSGPAVCDANSTRNSTADRKSIPPTGIHKGDTLTDAATLHSCSPAARPASLPLPPVSEADRQMTAGSGRRLSRSLNESSPCGAFLKTLLGFSAWQNPLRYLAWTSKVVGRDGHSVKSSRLFRNSDTTSRPMQQGFRAFRLFRLSQSGVRSVEIESGSSVEGKTWGTCRSTEHKGCGPSGSKSERVRFEKGALDAQASVHVCGKLWATAKPTSNTGNGLHGEGAMNLQTQAVDYSRTGATLGSNAARTGSGGQLNPDWVYWLMGFPAGWLNYADSATPGCRKSRSKSSGRSLKRR